MYSFLKNDYIHIEKNTFENESKFPRTVDIADERDDIFKIFAQIRFIHLESSSLLHTQDK